MLSDEIIVWGYIKVPYPYLDEFLRISNSLKGRQQYKDFPDFILPPITCIGNAMVMFGFNFRYEPDFENILLTRFELFLNSVKFLFASLQMVIDDKKYFFIEYVSDGEAIYKNVNSVIPASS
jgi:hypothetical protein